MSSIEHFALDERLQKLTAEPWRNGGGVTRTLASDGEGNAWTWRISVAEITRDGAYSRFDGVDRQQALIAGNELLLRGARGTQRLASAGDVFAFAGEDDVYACVPAGPVRMWNLMVRRGSAEAALRCVALQSGDALELRSTAPGGRAWVMVLHGHLHGDAGAVYPPGGVLALAHGNVPPALGAQAGGARLLLTTLQCRAGAPARLDRRIDGSTGRRVDR